MKNSPPTIDATSSRRDPEIIFATLENKLLELEEKSRLNVVKQNPTRLPKKDKMGVKCSKEVQKKISEDVRRSERKRKQPAKLKDCSDGPNFLTHVGTVVDVLWTEKDLEGTNWDPGWYRGEVQRYDENDDKFLCFISRIVLYMV